MVKVDNEEQSESSDQVVIWRIFVSEDARRFPNFFPIAFFETREKQ
jgi:hypothetical protein